MTANCITFSRILFSLLLLGFSLDSFPFTALYLLCGATDVLDGYVARKLRAESERGAALDSAADLVFAAVYAVRILPVLNIPLWILYWTALIAAAKIAGILIASKKARSMSIEHSFGNKLTGLLLFFLPLSVCVADVKYGAALACIVASGTVVKENIKNAGMMKAENAQKVWGK